MSRYIFQFFFAKCFHRKQDGASCYLSVSLYSLQWPGSSGEVVKQMRIGGGVSGSNQN